MMLHTIPMEKWGKDHWSVLAYAETCAVDQRGAIDTRRMRCNPTSHPMLALPQHAQRPGAYKYPTRVPDGELPEHDDWDCLYDLERAGLVQLLGTGLHPVVGMTAFGKKVAAALRQHKAAGGKFAEFSYKVTRDEVRAG